MGKWNAKIDGVLLSTFFETGVADPRHTTAADIDPIKEMDDSFAEFSKPVFRTNYKNTARAWCAGKAVEGTRYKNLFKDKKEGEEEIDGAYEEGEEEEEEEGTNDKKQEETKPAAAAMKKKAAQTKSSTPELKDDERKWEPIMQSAIFESKGFQREELMIEPTGSFDGTARTYSAEFNASNRIFTLKSAPNPVLGDSHSINSFYSTEYGITTSHDSARVQAFEKAARINAGKWFTYHHQLQWPGKGSTDLGLPWVIYTHITKMGRTYPTLIFNFSSIKPVEEKIEKLCSDLKMTSFKSPTKVKGVNIGSDPVAAMAALYQQMIDSGVSPTTMNLMKNNVRAMGFDPDAMNVVEEDSDENKKKRAKGNDAEDY